MAVSDNVLRRWERESAARKDLVAVLRQAGVEINYIHRTEDARSWGLIVKLPPRIAATFGIVRELLVWGAMHSTADARDVEQAQTVLESMKVRLTQDMLIVISPDRSADQLLKEAAAELGIRITLLSTDLIRTCQPIGTRSLADILRPQLVTRDLYDLRSSVTRGVDFFGRQDKLHDLERGVLQGDSHQSLFGLRKVGKTSILNRLRENLRNRGGVALAQVDLQRANAINPSAGYLLWHLGENLYDNNRRIRSTKDLALFGQYATFGEIPENISIYESFDHDVREIFKQHTSPVVMMFDEIERIFPKTADSPWRTDFVRFWQLLRGIDQEQPGRLRFVISGTNPDCVESHSILGLDNPIYSYFSVQYLRPLSESETTSLLQSYGKLMGIDWSTGVARQVFKHTGGHPAIVRTFASMMHQRLSPRHSAVSPDYDDCRDVADQFLLRQGPLLAQVLAILEDQYQDEYVILQTLADGRVHDFREMAVTFPQDTAHLIGYGLCGDPQTATGLASGLLHTHMQRRHRGRSLGLGRSDATGIIGSRIDEKYMVEALISTSGGYSTVYRASVTGHSDGVNPSKSIAIKVMDHGKLHLLEREVEVLQGYAHRNIVRFLDSGRLDGSRVYLAMEYIEGTTLRHYCEAATRPPEHTLLTWAWSLLDALVEIHPKEETIRKLRGKGQRQDLQELLDARYGYIHRDIKPENVIISKERGPVLIDFNLSVRVSTPVASVSATPGYLPMDMPPMWSPRIDLYALGLTLLQVAAGDSLTQSNRSDLILMMRESVSLSTADFIERLIATESHSFRAAYTARREVRRLLDAHS